MNKVHVILDEAASLKHLEIVDDLVDKYRGYGIRGQFYYQSLGQLKTCFPEGQDQTFLSNVVQCYFGVNDNVTAQYVSDRLGDGTIKVASGGTSWGTSSQHSSGMQPQSSHSESSNTNDNWQQQARRLLTPAEVMTLPPRMAITFVPGLPPICTTLLRYYENKHLGRDAAGLRGKVAACLTFAASAAICIACAVAAVGLTMILASNGWAPLAAGR